MDRRDFLKSTAALTGGLALNALAPSFAKASLTIGSATLSTLSDGFLTLPGTMAYNHLPEKELQTIIKTYKLDRTRITPDCNITLLQDGPRNILFDVGAGPNFMPSAGKLLQTLQTTSLTPDDITHVIFTHAHPDHLWGLLDDFDDPLFPNATYLMGKSEWDYWMHPQTVNSIIPSRQSFAVGAKNRLETLQDSILLFKDGEEILPNIAAHACFGHTPGHMAFEIRQNAQSAMIVGDAIGNHHIAFEKPDWHSGSDQDRDMGAKSRTRLLDKIATDNSHLVGFHLPNGGIGRCQRKNNSYHFISKA
ncbi:MAG: MBL fold metallo-hydrolase [Cohaesibacter sp.]|nr:MBL fold metallo-hydrolase [Cohaesibacter sp.]MCV6600810.1 MBL fold metallo-hydrolase [Cohaesibacter sp.]